MSTAVPTGSDVSAGDLPRLMTTPELDPNGGCVTEARFHRSCGVRKAGGG
jgi:hypothetical protein